MPTVAGLAQVRRRRSQVAMRDRHHITLRLAAPQGSQAIARCEQKSARFG